MGTQAPWWLQNSAPKSTESPTSVTKINSLAPGFILESPLSRFLTKTKSVERNRQWLDQLRTTFVQVMTSQSDSLRGGIIAEVLEKAIMAQERMVEERIFKKKPGPGEDVF